MMAGLARALPPSTPAISLYSIKPGLVQSGIYETMILSALNVLTKAPKDISSTS